MSIIFFSTISILLLIALTFIFLSLKLPTKHKVLISIPVLLIPIGIYIKIGGYAEIMQNQQRQQQEVKAKEILKKVNSVDEVLAMLQNKLKDNPNSVEGWYLLGRIYASIGNWQLANDSFNKAYTLEPKNEKIIVNLVESSWQLNNNKMSSQNQKLLDEVLATNNQNIAALSLLAVDAYLGHNYTSAINYWERILEILPKEHPDRAGVQKAIAKCTEESKIH